MMVYNRMANDYGPSNSYSAAIDMWACGCILAELLSMQKESHEQPDERAALFPGKTCFPLSAENVTAYSDRLDQLNGILVHIASCCSSCMSDE